MSDDGDDLGHVGVGDLHVEQVSRAAFYCASLSPVTPGVHADHTASLHRRSLLCSQPDRTCPLERRNNARIPSDSLHERNARSIPLLSPESMRYNSARDSQDNAQHYSVLD